MRALGFTMEVVHKKIRRKVAGKTIGYSLEAHFRNEELEAELGAFLENEARVSHGQSRSVTHLEDT